MGEADTTVNLQWISDHLAMKSAANASQQMRRMKAKQPKLANNLQTWSSQSDFATRPLFFFFFRGQD